MNFFEHARTMYRRRHVVRRLGAEQGLRSLEAMCDRRMARRKSPVHSRTGSFARRRRSFPAPLSFMTNRTGRRSL
jgi:hypothetical protein